MKRSLKEAYNLAKHEMNNKKVFLFRGILSIETGIMRKDKDFYYVVAGRLDRKITPKEIKHLCNMR